MTQIGIGKRLAHYRRIAGMSASALADATRGEVTRSIITNIENGRKQEVTVSELLALSKALSVPPAALVFEPGDYEGADWFCRQPAWDGVLHAQVDDHYLADAAEYEKLLKLPEEEQTRIRDEEAEKNRQEWMQTDPQGYELEMERRSLEQRLADLESWREQEAERRNGLDQEAP